MLGASYSDQMRLLQPPLPLGARASERSQSAAGPVQMQRAGEAVQLEGEKKEVSPKALARLSKSAAAIAHTKAAIPAAGNQKEALEMSKFNSYFRMACMRDTECWVVSSEAARWAALYPEAMTAAKADLAHGGNCGEHAAVAFDYLRTTAGDTVNRVAHTMDHAFVLIGDLTTETGAEIVACDPWPTAPTTCLFEDHFGYTKDPAQLTVKNTISGDDQDVKAIIAKGLSLSEKGKAMVNSAYSEEKTRLAIEDGRTNHPPSDKYPKGRKRWIWIHPNTATTVYDYVLPEEVPTADPATIQPAPDSVQDPEHAQDQPWARFLAWVRSWSE